MKNLTIVGGGSWGTALAIVLASRFERIRLWVYEADLAERMQLIEGVVDSGAAKLGQARDRTLKNLIGGQVARALPPAPRRSPGAAPEAQAASPQAPQQ